MFEMQCYRRFSARCKRILCRCPSAVVRCLSRLAHSTLRKANSLDPYDTLCALRLMLWGEQSEPQLTPSACIIDRFALKWSAVFHTEYFAVVCY